MKLGEENYNYIKILADILESLIGAIFLDSKLNI
jgi:dsRNA-specific ribonuclease